MSYSQRVKSLLATMTLEEKAAQLTQFNLNLLYAETKASLTGAAKRFQVAESDKNVLGSVLNFGYSERENAVKKLNEEYGEGIPLSFMMDIVHGCRTIFPIPLAMGCTFDERLVEDCAEMSAQEARLAGVDVTFSPMVDLVRDARWGRVMETTGEDHYLNGEMGKAFIRGYHKGGLACCIKHFCAYGLAEAGRDYNTTDASDFGLQEYYLHAYRECLKENPEMVMTSFNCLNGKPVNAHKEILIDLLREKWGYNGVVISDYSAIEEMIAHGYVETERECAKIALSNEIDIEMMSPTYIQYLPELVKEGEIPLEKVDRMVGRVLTLKEKLGLFENPLGGFDAEKGKAVFLCKANRDLVQKAAEKSFVLLKNEGVLPLNKSQNIALVGPFADELGIIGFWWAYGNVAESISLRAAFTEYLGREIPVAQGCTHDLREENAEGIAEAEAIAAKAEIVLVCIGEYEKHSGEGNSRAKINLSSAQTELVKRIKGTGKKVVGIVFGGRPLVLTEVEPYLDSILYVWQPGTEGARAIARTVYGENIPAGKTTMSFPRSVGQCPIHYNELHTGRRKAVDDFRHCGYSSSYLDELNAPLYPFGYGLSYTEFELSDFRISDEKVAPTSAFTAEITVKNVGDYDGEEVVQLYVRDCFGEYVRPVKELKGYKKVFLKKGEEKRVVFTLTVKELSYYNAKGDLVYELGSFEIMIGRNSRDLQVGKIVLTEK